MIEDDNNSELEELRIDRQRHALERGGASADDYRGRDARVSAALRIGVPWVLSIFGAGILAIGAYVGSSFSKMGDSIVQLNLTMAKVIVRLDQKDTRDDRQDTRDDRQDAHMEATDRLVSDLKGDVKELQGKTFRGIDGYPKEAKRGR